jgi:hypothetical protein
LSFLFFLLWPWFVIEGEQSIELELRDSTIAWRMLRDTWIERPADELVSASVEPWIMYVKGQPGRR